MAAMPSDDAGLPDTGRTAGSPAAPPALATERLRGERLGPEHLAALAPILGDPRVGATLGGVRNPDEIARMLEQAAEGWRRDGVGYWMFFETATGSPVARGGLSHAVFAGLGFVYERTAPYKEFGDHVLYRLAAGVHAGARRSG